MNKLRLLKSIAFVGLISVSSLLNAQTAKLQAIHNSPHPTAASVDVWVSSSLGTSKLLTDFKFREATPFVDVPAGIPVTVAIALPGSTTINDTVAGLSISATLADAERYVLLAQGNVSTVGYAVNPNAINTAFQFIPVGGIRPASNNPTEVDFLVVHGSPDAPGVDIYARGIGAPIIPNLQYNQSSAYVNVPAGKYILDINVENTSTTVFTKVADLSGLAGNAITVFASG